MSHNIQNYDTYLIMPEPGKFDFKINIIPNELEKYMSFNINNKLIFIDSFQFLSYSLDSSVQNLSKNYLNYLSQGFDSKVLYLVEQKVFYSFEHMSDFEKIEEKIPSKEIFYSCLTSTKIVMKSMSMFSRFGINLKWKRWKIIITCT